MTLHQTVTMKIMMKDLMMLPHKEYYKEHRQNKILQNWLKKLMCHKKNPHLVPRGLLFENG
jgi:hypothetical protein